MFAGMIQAVATVESIHHGEQGAVLALRSEVFANQQDPVAIGDSIAVSGVCLTITRFAGPVSFFDISSETLRCTTLGNLIAGKRVNIERSLKLSDRVDGHLVQGHVDATAEILSRSREGETERFEFSLPAEVAPFVVPKGSIAIDGVSLTVGEVSKTSFAVYLIPHSLQATTFQDQQVGEIVNLESDAAARYAYRAVELLLAQRGKDEA